MVFTEQVEVQAPPESVSVSGRSSSWLEFLGFVDSSTTGSDSASAATSMQRAEPEPQLQQGEDADSRRASLVQTRIVPLVEKHGLRLLQELRLSELVRCVGAVSGKDGLNDSEFQLGGWLQRLHKDGCASLALAPWPLIFSYTSEKSSCGTGSSPQRTKQLSAISEPRCEALAPLLKRRLLFCWSLRRVCLHLCVCACVCVCVCVCLCVCARARVCT